VHFFGFIIRIYQDVGSLNVKFSVVQPPQMLCRMTPSDWPSVAAVRTFQRECNLWSVPVCS